MSVPKIPDWFRVGSGPEPVFSGQFWIGSSGAGKMIRPTPFFILLFIFSNNTVINFVSKQYKILELIFLISPNNFLSND